MLLKAGGAAGGCLLRAGVLGWLPLMGVELPEDQVRRIRQEGEEALGPFVAREEGIAFEMPAHVVTGVKA